MIIPEEVNLTELNQFENNIEKKVEEGNDIIDSSDRVLEAIHATENLKDTSNYNDVCLILNNLRSAARNIGVEEYQVKSLAFFQLTHTENLNLVTMQVATEDARSIYDKVMSALESLFTFIWNSIKAFAVKAMTLYPVIENNCQDLFNYIENNKRTKQFKIEDRNALKWVINKCPLFFRLATDIPTLETLISSSNRMDIIKALVNETLTYGNILNSENPDVNPTGFTDKVNNAITNLIKNNNSKIFNPLKQLVKGIPNDVEDKTQITVYRVDGKIAKYREVTIGSTISGISSLVVTNRTYKLESGEEDQIAIGKLYSPDELARLIRTDMNFISTINSFYNSAKEEIKKIENQSKSIKQFYNSNAIKSSAYMAALNNYFKLSKFIIASLAVELFVSHYKSAQNIYYMVLKYTELGFEVKRDMNTISKEDALGVTPPVEDVPSENKEGEGIDLLPEVVSINNLEEEGTTDQVVTDEDGEPVDVEPKTETVADEEGQIEKTGQDTLNTQDSTDYAETQDASTF